ncbi:TonB family protein [Altererythrobacter sp. H2]|uniref:energy transducer TonB n=1 Tax=Altererythrobacter sp. H2 TaxID=3108391 RepID=UPI002B4C221F|nr:TonB family protein [Altererythrobacter sp. H2]WRK96753.1 TonB family protein [Altererythrobacter sp. H2]
MAYTDSKRPADRAASVAGVIAVHAALGYALVIGLQFTGVIPPPEPRLKGETVVDPIPLPPPPKPTPDTKTPTDSKVYTPDTVITINTNDSAIDATTVLPPPGDIVVKPIPGPTIIPSPGPSITPAAEAVAAKARNNPHGWITEADYKTSWINRGYAGTAGFRLAIGASGRVEGCQITRSTGHTALDEATCSLVTRRARFEPARNGTGDKVPGSYASSVLWQIPD